MVLWGKGFDVDQPASLPWLRDTAVTALHAELVSGRRGTRVRLEQERIDWAWAHGRFTTCYI